MHFCTIKGFEPWVVVLVKDQRQVCTGQHDGLAAVHIGQSLARPDEYLPMLCYRDPSAGHTDVGIVNFLQVLRWRNNFYTFEHAIELRLHHDTGSKQANFLEATPLDFQLDDIEQVDNGNG